MKPRIAQLLLVLMACMALFSCRSEKGDTLSYWEQYPMDREKVACFLFVVPDCPLAMNYTKEFMNLYREFKDSAVRFVAIIPGNLYSSHEIEDFCQTYHLEAPLIVDKNLSLTEAFGATVSPECFVYNREGQRLYYGKMDEWVKELGSKFGGHGRNYAREAIMAGLQNSYPIIRHKDAIGCSIEIE